MNVINRNKIIIFFFYKTIKYIYSSKLINSGINNLNWYHCKKGWESNC